MKNLKDILEVKNDKEVDIPEWADFMRIGITDEIIQFLTFDELTAEELGTPATSIEKLKPGESFFDDKDNAVWVMLTDLKAFNRE